MTFAISLDPDQTRQNVYPDHDHPICLTLRWYSWKNFVVKADLEKISRRQKKYNKFPRSQRVKTDGMESILNIMLKLFVFRRPILTYEQM